ncbi:type IX secretion system membrane protein PorP/SprF [Flavobacterium humidisoli]
MFFLGYGYDFETNKLMKFNSDTHKLFLRYEVSNRCKCYF